MIIGPDGGCLLHGDAQAKRRKACSQGACQLSRRAPALSHKPQENEQRGTRREDRAPTKGLQQRSGDGGRARGVVGAIDEGALSVLGRSAGPKSISSRI